MKDPCFWNMYEYMLDEDNIEFCNNIYKDVFVEDENDVISFILEKTSLDLDKFIYCVDEISSIEIIIKIKTEVEVIEYVFLKQ